MYESWSLPANGIPGNIILIIIRIKPWNTRNALSVHVVLTSEKSSCYAYI